MSGVATLAFEEARKLLARARERRLTHSELLELETCLQILEVEIKDLTSHKWGRLQTFLDVWRSKR